jgi:undecaprenyl-diphosphatase
MMEFVLQLDRALFFFLNGLQHPVLDTLMLWITYRFTWFPFYGVLVYLLVKHFGKNSIPMIVCLLLTVILADQVSSGFFKPYFARLRPCHDPLMEGVSLVGHCGGRFGFVSSHAADTFGAATCLWLLVREYWKPVAWMFAWAAVVSYSRIYLGVHYPLDIALGALLGALLAFCCYGVYTWYTKLQKQRRLKVG